MRRKLSNDVNNYRSKWEEEIRLKSEAVINLSKAQTESSECKEKNINLQEKLMRTAEERKLYKTKYEKQKKQKMEADSRAEKYRSVGQISSMVE